MSCRWRTESNQGLCTHDNEDARAYNRTAHLAERRETMQQWADYPVKLKAGADVIPLHNKA